MIQLTIHNLIDIGLLIAGVSHLLIGGHSKKSASVYFSSFILFLLVLFRVVTLQNNSIDSSVGFFVYDPYANFMEVLLLLLGFFVLIGIKRVSSLIVVGFLFLNLFAAILVLRSVDIMAVLLALFLFDLSLFLLLMSSYDLKRINLMEMIIQDLLLLMLVFVGFFLLLWLGGSSSLLQVGNLSFRQTIVSFPGYLAPFLIFIPLTIKMGVFPFHHNYLENLRRGDFILSLFVLQVRIVTYAGLMLRLSEYLYNPEKTTLLQVGSWLTPFPVLSWLAIITMLIIPLLIFREKDLRFLLMAAVLALNLQVVLAFSFFPERGGLLVVQILIASIFITGALAFLRDLFEDNLGKEVLEGSSNRIASSYIPLLLLFLIVMGFLSLPPAGTFILKAEVMIETLARGGIVKFVILLGVYLLMVFVVGKKVSEQELPLVVKRRLSRYRFFDGMIMLTISALLIFSLFFWQGFSGWVQLYLKFY